MRAFGNPVENRINNVHKNIVLGHAAKSLDSYQNKENVFLKEALCQTEGTLTDKENSQIYYKVRKEQVFFDPILASITRSTERCVLTTLTNQTKARSKSILVTPIKVSITPKCEIMIDQTLKVIIIFVYTSLLTLSLTIHFFRS